MTIRDIMLKHPEWIDRQLAVQDAEGELHFVDQTAIVYALDEDMSTKEYPTLKMSVLVFSEL